MRAWHIDESKLDENKLELSENERELVNLEDLKEHTGVLYWKVRQNFVTPFYSPILSVK